MNGHSALGDILRAASLLHDQLEAARSQLKCLMGCGAKSHQLGGILPRSKAVRGGCVRRHELAHALVRCGSRERCLMARSPLRRRLSGRTAARRPRRRWRGRRLRPRRRRARAARRPPRPRERLRSGPRRPRRRTPVTSTRRAGGPGGERAGGWRAVAWVGRRTAGRRTALRVPARHALSCVLALAHAPARSLYAMVPLR
jgi:hypothetical protein